MVSKYIGFRCPEKLYNEVLEPLKDNMNTSMSKFIKSAIKSHKDLLNGLKQYSKLFHLIEEYFRYRNTLDKNKLIDFIQSSITNTESIDKIERIIKWAF